MTNADPAEVDLLVENARLRAELIAANAIIAEAVSANLASSNVLDAANGMINALKKSPLEAPLLRAHNAAAAADRWVLVGSKS
jgi:hypothetical protein